MRHSFISWDSSFRNFHHLIDGLACQTYDLDEVELIYVEQRCRKKSDAYNHGMGLPSLYDRVKSPAKISIKAVFMDEAEDVPYHLGRILNVGIKQAKGEIITVMDGDLLLPSDFIGELDKLHRQCPSVINVERKMCSRPLGVSYEEWYKAEIDYERCLSLCAHPEVIPDYVTNKAPMISAPALAFKEVGGFEEHPMFATGLSRAGQDLNARLEIAIDSHSRVISRVAVHPFHPAGFSRKTLDAVRVLRVQADIIKWTRQNKLVYWRDREGYLELVYTHFRKLFTRVHTKDYSNTSFATFFQSTLAGTLYKGVCRVVRPFKP